MRPFPKADGHDAPRAVDQLVPRIATVIDDVFGAVEDAVGEPVVADELPDVLDWVEFGALCWQRHERDVGGDREFGRQMPPGLVHQQHRVRSWGDGGRDLGQMEVHRFDVALGQDQRRALAIARADGAEDVG